MLSDVAGAQYEKSQEALHIDAQDGCIYVGEACLAGAPSGMAVSRTFSVVSLCSTPRELWTGQKNRAVDRRDVGDGGGRSEGDRHAAT